MSEKKYTKKVSIDINLVDYIDNFGNSHSITEEELQDVISDVQYKVDLILSENERNYISKNKIFEFKSFEIDSNILKKYTEKDENIYKHFVWEFYSKYYIGFKKDSEEHLELLKYIKKLPKYYKEVESVKLKLKKLENKFKKGKLNLHEFEEEKFKLLRYVARPITIKSYILGLLQVSSMLESNPDFCKKYLLNINKENFKQFVDFIIGSGMFKMDEMVIKNNLSEDSVSIDNLTVGASLVDLCIHLDYEEGFEYLIDMGLNEKSIDINENHHSYIYMFIKQCERLMRGVYWRERDYINEHNLTQPIKNIDSERNDKVDVLNLNKLIRKFQWIEIITKKFPKLKLGLVNQNGSVIEDDGRRYWSSAKVQYEYRIIIPNYLDKIFHDKKFSNLVYNFFSKDFIKNNTLTLSKEVQLVKNIFDYFKNINNKSILSKIQSINHNDISCVIEKIENGGYIEGDRILKDYDSTLQTKEVYFTKNKNDNNFSVYFYKHTNPHYNNSDYKLENKFELNKFLKNKDILISTIEGWFSGCDLKNKSSESLIKLDKQKILKEIITKQKELEDLQKKLNKPSA